MHSLVAAHRVPRARLPGADSGLVDSTAFVHDSVGNLMNDVDTLKIPGNRVRAANGFLGSNRLFGAVGRANVGLAVALLGFDVLSIGSCALR
jgi:hypothetical protein